MPPMIIAAIISALGGLLGGGMGQRQQNQQQQQQVELERRQREAAAEVAARRREQIQGVIEQNRNELAGWAETIRRGAEYSGLEAGASRDASRNVAAANAAAALSGVGNSGMAESQAGAIMADAIGQTAMARLQDQFSRESAIGQREAGLQQLAAQLLSDPSFSVGSGDELTAGFDALTGVNPFGSALMGGIGAALPLIAQWGLGSLGQQDAGAQQDAGGLGIKVPGAGAQQQQNQFSMQQAIPWLALLGQQQQQNPWGNNATFSSGNAFSNPFGG